jgi:hypothetical protein
MSNVAKFDKYFPILFVNNELSFATDDIVVPVKSEFVLFCTVVVVTVNPADGLANVTLVTPDPTKASVEILVTPAGIVIDDKLVAPLKTFAPTLDRLAGRVIDDKLVAP